METGTASAKGRTVLVVQEGPGKVVFFSDSHPSERRTAGVGEKPHELELTPDGRTAFVSNFGLLEVNHQIGTPGTTLSVLDLERRIERRRFDLSPGYTAPHGLKLRPSYRELFTNTEMGKEAMVVLDAESGAVLRTFALPPGVDNFLFNADGSALFAFTTANQVVHIDPDRGTVATSTKVGTPRGLTWTADHRQLIVGGKNDLLFLNPAGLSIESRLGNLEVGQIFYPAASPDGQWIFAPAVLDGVVLVIEAETGNIAHRIQTGSPLQVIPDGKRAWVSNVLVPPEMLEPNAEPRMGGVVLIDLRTFKTTPIADIPDANGIAVSQVR